MPTPYGSELFGLEREIRDALIAARALLYSKTVNAQQVTDLRKKLMNLADRAADAGYPFSEQCLEDAADDLEVKIGGKAHSP